MRAHLGTAVTDAVGAVVTGAAAIAANQIITALAAVSVNIIHERRTTLTGRSIPTVECQVGAVRVVRGQNLTDEKEEVK